MDLYHADPGWDSYIREIKQLPPHVDRRAGIDEIGGIPLGFYRSMGESRGQKEDYRLALADGTGIHIRVYADHYMGHWDKRDPKRDALGHLLHDSPHWLVGVAAASMAGLYALHRYKSGRDCRVDAK